MISNENCILLEMEIKFILTLFINKKKKKNDPLFYRTENKKICQRT